MDNIAKSNQQLNNEKLQAEAVHLENRKALCTECDLCATILCFATFFGIISFVGLAVIANYREDPNNYAPYSIVFICILIGSLICKFYTRCQLKDIDDTERLHRLNRVEEAIISRNQVKATNSFKAMASRNSLYSKSDQDGELKESVEDESAILEDYPTVIQHGDIIEYVFGPLPMHMCSKFRNASPKNINSYDQRAISPEQQLSQANATNSRDSLNFNEQKDKNGTLPLPIKFPLQSNNLKPCSDSAYFENVPQVKATKVDAVEKECVIEDYPEMISSQDTAEYVLGATAINQSIDERQESNNGTNIPVIQECFTDQHEKFPPRDTLAFVNKVHSDAECNKVNRGHNIHIQSKRHTFATSVAPCNVALTSGNETDREVFGNKLVTTKQPSVIYHTRPVEQVSYSLLKVKSVNKVKERENDFGKRSSPKIPTQKFYESGIRTFRDSLFTEEESYSGYSEYDTDESVIEENEGYPVVKRDGDTVEYIFGPPPARMLEERRKLMQTDSNTSVFRI